MSNNLKINLNKPSVVGVITQNKLQKYVTKWAWEKLLEGGKGEFVEDIVLDYLTNVKHYKNIVKSRSQSSHDFHLKEDNDVLIDIRRFGKTKNKTRMYLGYTSSNKGKRSWEDKAKYLKKGGYLGALMYKDKMFLYYLPAEFLIKNFSKKNLELEQTLTWLKEHRSN